MGTMERQSEPSRLPATFCDYCDRIGEPSDALCPDCGGTTTEGEAWECPLCKTLHGDPQQARACGKACVARTLRDILR